MKPKKNELFAGFFVLTMIFVFMIMLSFMSTKFRWGVDYTTAVTYFHSISGLQTNVPVTYQGIPVGTITGLDLLKNSELTNPPSDLIQVTMKIESNFQMPDRALATITQTTLLSELFVEITSTIDHIDKNLYVRGDPTVVEKEGVLYFDAIDPTSIGVMMAQGNRILDDVRGLTRQFPAYGDTIGHMLTGADELVADPFFREDVHAVAEGARSAVDDIRVSAAKLPRTMENASAFMAKAHDAAARIDSIVAESQDTITTIVENVDELTFNAKVLTYGLAESPWRVVWKDKEWQKRVVNRDPGIINASLRSEATVVPSDESMDEAKSALKPERKNRSGY